MTLPSDRKPQKARIKPEKGDKAFDAWLKQGLHKLYDDITHEPIPKGILDMIEADRKK